MPEKTTEIASTAIAELSEIVKTLLSNPIAAGTAAVLVNRLLYQEGFYEPRKMMDGFDEYGKPVFLQFGYKNYEVWAGGEVPENLKGWTGYLPGYKQESNWQQLTSSWKTEEMSDVERVNYEAWLKVNNVILTSMALWAGSSAIQATGNLVKLIPAPK